MVTLRASGAKTVATAAIAGMLVLAPSPASAEPYSPSYTWERNLKDSRIHESSGLARSTRFPGVVWTHNDKGDSPRVFAVGEDGATRGVVTLSGASAVDWEDMAAGPDHTLWVGDIGDNGRTRSTIDVYRFTEPTTLAGGTAEATRYRLRYPDGASRDAEGLMVDPSGRIYVVHKGGPYAAIYRAPDTLSTTSTNTLTRVAPAPPKVTAASWAPDGRSFTLAGYTEAWTYSSLGGTPVTYEAPGLRQGESVEYTAGSSELLFGTEGSTSPVYATPAPSTSPSTSPSPARSLSLVPGSARAATGPSRFLDGQAGTSFTVPAATDSGSGLYLGTLARSSGKGTGYLGRARFVDGAMELSVVRRKSGRQVQLGRVRLGSYAAGETYRVVVRVTGTSTVKVQARVYRPGDDIPAWQVTAHDSSAERIAVTGDTYAFGYLSSSAGSAKEVPYHSQR